MEPATFGIEDIADLREELGVSRILVTHDVRIFRWRNGNSDKALESSFNITGMHYPFARDIVKIDADDELSGDIHRYHLDSFSRAAVEFFTNSAIAASPRAALYSQATLDEQWEALSSTTITHGLPSSTSPPTLAGRSATLTGLRYGLDGRVTVARERISEAASNIRNR